MADLDLDIAIVGGGPTATYALDRLLAALAFERPRVPMRIGVFDRNGRFGCGDVHADDQPGSSYMNRAAGDIAFGADSSNALSSLLPGTAPDFLGWLGTSERGSAFVAQHGRDVAAATPSRALHGAGLRAAMDRSIAALQARGLAEVTRVAAEVQDAFRTADAERLGLACSDPLRPRITCRRLLLVTGHGRMGPSAGEAGLSAFARDRPGLAYVSDAYPLSSLGGSFEIPGSAVCVTGLGLTAIDVFLYLTEGQGGLFRRRPDGTLAYEPCGGEPRRIIGIGPSGHLITTRPRNQKAERGSPAYRARFFTEGAVARLRQSVGVSNGRMHGAPRRQLDFEAHVMPLILMEMAYVFHRTAAGSDFLSGRFETAAAAAYDDFLAGRAGGGEAAVDRLVGPLTAAARLRPGGSAFDWRSFIAPPGDAADWHRSAVDAARRDLACARRGNLDDPAKAAADAVWRDLRGTLNAVVDRGGLTAGSERVFASRHLRLYHRMSNGACIEAMEKVIALCEADIVDLSMGPEARVSGDAAADRFRVDGPATGRSAAVDAVIHGRVRPFDPDRDRCPLYANMIAAGLLRRWSTRGLGGEADHSGGAIEVDADHFAVSRDGEVDHRIALVGTPVEGLRYFQQSAARPRSGSAVIDQLAGWALASVRSLDEDRAIAV